MNAEERPPMPRIQVLHVKPRLPERLEPLRELAYNLRWAWDQDTIELFHRLDAELWEEVGHNPVELLGRVDQGRLERVMGDPGFLDHLDICHRRLTEHLAAATWYSRTHAGGKDLVVAYFSAEFGITESVRLYSGGLGVLAGDHLKSASELGIPLVGVGLAYHQGYFKQYLNADGWQQEVYLDQDFFNLPLVLQEGSDGDPMTVTVRFPGRDVRCCIWLAQVGRVALYLLDTNLEANLPHDRNITRRLYGGDAETRIQQEIVLGIGGLRALRALGIDPDVCHMNEGHAAFLGVERARQIMKEHGVDYDTARQTTAASNIFTTHTPVPAGFDLFDRDLMEVYFADYVEDLALSFEDLMKLGRVDPENGGPFNMALFAVRHSSFRNGVSRLHGKVSRAMMRPWWPGYPQDEIPVESITNGIHLRSWISAELQETLHRHLGEAWTDDPADVELWRKVDGIPDEELWRVHQACKQRLVAFARRRLCSQIAAHGGSSEELAQAERVLDPERLTIGFARRFVTYKRATLLLRDMERLERMIKATETPVQFVFAGKAHPADGLGKEIIKRIVHFAQASGVRASVVFLENYDINVGRHLVQGVDVWLNTPRRPLEASGTSGMKAAVNGALNLSVLDGWWDEGFDPAVGWAIGHGERYDNDDYQDAVEASVLYDLLEREVVPLYYSRDDRGIPGGWIHKMRAAIRELSPVFNTNRMVSEYAERFYLPAAGRSRDLRRDHLQRMKGLVDWSRHVREHWSDVRVAQIVEQDGPELHVGDPVPVRVQVNLGRLRPEDVSVELYHGAADAEHHVRNGAVTRLEPAGEEDGLHWYAGVLTVPVSGLYGYTVRVRPRHSDALIPNELPLITWY